MVAAALETAKMRPSENCASRLAYAWTERYRLSDPMRSWYPGSGGSDGGAPGLRPHYHANYYGAYVRDPDGNKLQAVCHRRPDAG